MTDSRTIPGIDTPTRIAATCAVGVATEAVIFLRFGWAPPLAAYLCFGAVATVVSASDLAVRRVPNAVVLPGLACGVALLGLGSGLDATWWSLARAGIAMVVLAGFYLALGLAFSSGMGMGDVKWAAVVGLYLGWLGWPAVVTGTLLAFLAGGLFVIGRRFARPTDHRTPLPFAPFMAGGALVVVLGVR